MKAERVCVLHTSCQTPKHALQLMQDKLACGFPSPSSDYLEHLPSLDELLIKHPAASYVARASGDSMIERGILDGSLLIIDRAIPVEHNATIVASVAGELTVKILDLQHQLLRPANKTQKPIPIPDDLDVICEGVVTFCINPQGNCAFSC